ncbi:Uncharacterised protein [Mycobacterium tuberculosis]|nr:Uncharacterised protein [Mycobacterium tuberculosis]
MTCSCSAEVADTGNNASPPASGVSSGPEAAGSDTGACSKMACTLVPDIPYEETAARRGCPVLSGQDVFACGTKSSVSISAS